MKFNSKLWMLAVAMATVGCQDDLENDPNNGGGVELKGEKALIQVVVNAGITTRAADPTPGEEGDGDEAGTIEESMVHDVTVFLFRNDGNPDDFDFKSTSTIYAAGYVADENSMSGGSTEHSFYKEVEISGLYPKEKLVDGNPYGVIAVTNLGSTDADKLRAELIPVSESDPKKTGEDLANYIQKSYGNAENGFVMSTHKMKVGTDQSIVIPTYVTSTEDAPSVNVYVERLAAKIRINEYEDNNFVYDVTNHDGDKVILNNVAIVNQLDAGEYLIKRVTENAETGEDLNINPQNLQVVLEGMRSVTDDQGTASSVFQNFEIAVGGKTGSAEAPGNKVNAWFAGFAPFENPEIAVVVMVENGGHGYYAGEAVREIMREYFGMNTENVTENATAVPYTESFR